MLIRVRRGRAGLGKAWLGKARHGKSKETMNIKRTFRKLKKLDKLIRRHEKTIASLRRCLNGTKGWLKEDKTERKKLINSLSETELIQYGNMMGYLDNIEKK